MPRPVQAPPTVQFDDVTKGYVPEEESFRRYYRIIEKKKYFIIVKHTKVNVKESSIGPFNQNFLWRSMQDFIHIVDSISDQRPQSLSVLLELFQLVLNINCQGWIHGLVLVDKVLESKGKRNKWSCWTIVWVYSDSKLIYHTPMIPT